jgi:hypothetical protein
MNNLYTNLTSKGFLDTLYTFRIENFTGKGWCQVRMMCIDQPGKETIYYDHSIHTGEHFMAKLYAARLAGDDLLVVNRGDGYKWLCMLRDQILFAYNEEDFKCGYKDKKKNEL